MARLRSPVASRTVLAILAAFGYLSLFISTFNRRNPDSDEVHVDRTSREASTIQWNNALLSRSSNLGESLMERFGQKSRTSSYSLKDTRFDLIDTRAKPVHDKQSILVLTLINNRDNWGKDRSFLDFVKIVQSFDYPIANLKLGILVSDKDEFNAIVDTVKRWPDDDPIFQKIRVIFREKSVGIARQDRKGDNVQKVRRRLIARLRNFLLYSTLGDEDAVLWIDSDMTHIPPDVLSRMADSGKDIITTATTLGPGGPFYDLNAWAGERIKPNEQEMKIVEEGGIFVPRPLQVKYTHELSGGDFAELDAVGGTVLFVRGEVHREGVAFTTNNVIGTGWNHEGYDGIETEGLCYVAKFLGYKCWGMPHTVAEHSLH
ncbi:hypothetical protein BGZ72_008857 [Mortierella alpina]|nr:hypothetical protein BGZ72_008857 [Mortierella alpina]